MVRKSLKLFAGDDWALTPMTYFGVIVRQFLIAAARLQDKMRTHFVLAICLSASWTQLCLGEDAANSTARRKAHQLAGSGLHQVRLLKYLFNPDRYVGDVQYDREKRAALVRRYDKRVRPVRDINTATNVTFRMNLYQLLDVVSYTQSSTQQRHTLLRGGNCGETHSGAPNGGASVVHSSLW